MHSQFNCNLRGNLCARGESSPQKGHATVAFPFLPPPPLEYLNGNLHIRRRLVAINICVCRELDCLMTSRDSIMFEVLLRFASHFNYEHN